MHAGNSIQHSWTTQGTSPDWCKTCELKSQGNWSAHIPWHTLQNHKMPQVTPKSGVPLNLQMSETRILIRLLWIIFLGNGNSAQLCQNLGFGGGGGVKPPHPHGTQLAILQAKIFVLQTPVRLIYTVYI
jgi:hypothetical protein